MSKFGNPWLISGGVYLPAPQKRQHKILVPKDIAEDNGAPRTTSASVMQVGSRLLRSCAQNAMVIAAVTLQSKVHRRLAAIFTSVGEPLNLWYGQAAKQCQNSDANSEWLKAQMGGGIVGLCDATLKQLVSPLVVEERGFQSFEQSPPQDLNEMSTIEDDLVEKMGHLCLELVAHRATPCA